ncbi:MAG: SOS response-associated peptidase [Flavobacteriales bacterium]|nr:SOS response-associated peptidase [Flavobacteriales bacterium]
MCGRYVLVQKVEAIEKRFQVERSVDFVCSPSVNIGVGRSAPVITDHDPTELNMAVFGLTPFWAKKRLYFFNARAEGDRNKENDPNYRGALDIIVKPAFRRSIRSKRCLVPFDAFVEGTTEKKLSEPFLVHLTDRPGPHAFAGIWDDWQDPLTGRSERNFAIITTVANRTIQALPHHRSPVLLHRDDERLWLQRDLPLADVLALLRPYPAEAMNAWPLDPAIKDPRAEGPELLRPTGDPVRQENELVFSVDLLLQGMGSGKR